MWSAQPLDGMVRDNVDSDAFTAVILALHQYTALPLWPVDEDVDLV
jgi:hypothetical protein